jgi:hypothetical protein
MDYHPLSRSVQGPTHARRSTTRADSIARSRAASLPSRHQCCLDGVGLGKIGNLEKADILDLTGDYTQDK